ncbi:MAG TPA: chemotaxis protein, partial [Cyanobacteria bacterium UBA12227]|nr:chemotaxis protein [Cyanobacteria bacterium UBA12227]
MSSGRRQMASGTDYMQDYGQAQKAYMQGNYQEAAEIIDRLIEDFPDDPSALLLRGHIYCYGLHQYDVARQQYERVLTLSSEPDFIDYANKGLEDTNQVPNGADSLGWAASSEDYEDSSPNLGDTDDLSDPPTFQTLSHFDSTDDLEGFDLGSLDFDDSAGEDFSSGSAMPFANPFGSSANDRDTMGQAVEDESDPFALGVDSEAGSGEFESWDDPSSDFELDGSLFGTAEGADDLEDFIPDPTQDHTAATFVMPQGELFNPAATDDVASSAFDMDSELDTSAFDDALMDDDYSAGYPSFEEETFLMGSGGLPANFTTHTDDLNDLSEERGEPSETFGTSDYSQDDQTFDQNGYNSPDHFDFDTFDEAFSSEAFTMDDVAEADSESFSGIGDDQNTTEGFLDAFDVFEDDLGSLPDFSLGDRDDMSSDGGHEPDFDVLSNSGVVPTTGGSIGLSDNGDSLPFGFSEGIRESFTSRRGTGQDYAKGSSDEEVFSLSGGTEQIPVFSPTNKEPDSEPMVSVEQGWLAPFENASLQQKQWITAIAAGVVSMVTVAVVSFVAQSTAAKDKPEVVSHLHKTSGFMTLIAGAASFGTTLFLGRITTKQIQRSTADLQGQFDSVAQGNLNVSVPVYSEGEFGQLAAGFNQMARVIMTTMTEAQRKAEEQEQAKEDLQRQVIRLLDDVEGAARGDLTVQAEVTADVLGAVADSFNLTIQNLREIVQQVKDAARKVTKGSTDSESFA